MSRTKSLAVWALLGAALMTSAARPINAQTKVAYGLSNVFTLNVPTQIVHGLSTVFTLGVPTQTVYGRSSFFTLLTTASALQVGAFGLSNEFALNTFDPGMQIGVSPDFNRDNQVDFDDFFLFAGVFGQKATGVNAKFDLDIDGEIGFGDFFEFASAFGKKV